MKKNKIGESFLGIIIGVFILSIVILGLANLISYSRMTVQSHQDTENISLLYRNSYNLIENLDLTTLNVGDIFYIYKNPATTNFELFIGIGNNQYKFIDKLGQKIDDINTFEGDIYTREFLVEKEDMNIGTDNYIIKIDIKKYN